MNDDEKKLMQAYGIQFARKNVYSYKEFKYERLDDAIRYAEIDAQRNRKEDVARFEGMQRHRRS